MPQLLANIVVAFLFLVILAVVVTMLLHLWLRVPYVPTPMPVVRAMIAAAELRGDEVVYDLGAGDARLLVEAVRRFPGIRAVGLEFVPTIWLLGKIRILLAGAKVRWKLVDAFKEDVSDADVIFLYLTPRLLARLAERFDRQLRPGTRVVSHAFRFPGREPVREERLRTWWGGTRVLVYEWR